MYLNYISKILNGRHLVVKNIRELEMKLENERMKLKNECMELQLGKRIELNSRGEDI